MLIIIDVFYLISDCLFYFHNKQIYTDWANHYLKKRYYELDQQQSQLLSNDQSSSVSSKIPAASSSKLCNNRNNRPLITSLINDLHDGVLLIHLVESVSK